MGFSHISNQAAKQFTAAHTPLITLNEFVSRVQQQAANAAAISQENLQNHLGPGVANRTQEEISARQSLSERAREVQAQQAFLSHQQDYIPDNLAHMRAFYRYDPTQDAMSYAINNQLIYRPQSAVSVVFQNLGAPPTEEQLRQMTDAQLVENYPRILQFAQIANSAQTLLADNRFSSNQQQLQQLAAMRDILNISAQRVDLIASPYYAQTDPQELLRSPDLAQRAQNLREPSPDVAGSNALQPDEAEALAEYFESANAIQQIQANNLSQQLSQAMTANAEKGFGTSVIPNKTFFYNFNGEMIRDASGAPAQADSTAVLSALMSGQHLVGMQGGRAAELSISADNGVLLQLQSADPSLAAARNQPGNISPEAFNTLLDGITAGDSAMLIFTGSRQYKALKTQMESFRDTYGDVNISTLTAAQRQEMMAALTSLHAASQDYLLYKHEQRSGDLSGTGRRYEKTRIDAALAIKDFTELTAAQLGSQDLMSKAYSEREADRRQNAQFRSDYDINLMSNQDRATGILLQHYSLLAAQSSVPAVTELAGELRDNAALLGAWTSRAMTSQEQGQFRDLMTKMVAINLLTAEKEQIDKGIILPPGRYAQAYQENKDGFIKSVSDLLPKEANELTPNTLILSNHTGQLNQLALGVKRNQITRNMEEYYGQLAQNGASPTIKQLAGELRDNAGLLSTFSTNERAYNEQSQYLSLLSKMVLVNLLTTEKVGQENGVVNPPGKFEAAYKDSPDTLTLTISSMMPREVSINGGDIMASSGFGRQMGQITKDVQTTMAKSANPKLNPVDLMINVVAQHGSPSIQQNGGEIKPQPSAGPASGPG